jgi:hypothetical protein
VLFSRLLETKMQRKPVGCAPNTTPFRDPDTMYFSPVANGELNRARINVCWTQCPAYVISDASSFIRSCLAARNQGNGNVGHQKQG